MLNKLRAWGSGFFFLTLNFFKFSFVPRIDEVRVGGVFYRGAVREDADIVFSMYSHLNNGIKMDFFKKIFYYFFSCRFFLVAESQSCDGARSIVGINFYYLNFRDFKEGTVHEGFVGVAPGFEGQGIATAIRRLAVRHFENSGFSGISSRVSCSNFASLKSARKIGYEPVEKYFDDLSGELRFYLVCKLKENSD